MNKYSVFMTRCIFENIGQKVQRLSTIIDLVPKSLVAARLHNNIYRKSNKYSEISTEITWEFL